MRPLSGAELNQLLPVATSYTIVLFPCYVGLNAPGAYLLFIFIFLQPNSFCLQKYVGHNSHVMSLDFHPKKNDLFCSCDANSEIRFWNINQYPSTRVSKVTFDYMI